MKSQHHVTVNIIDQNDSPSSPRSVHVIVYAYNDVFPLGNIADVHPNDPDTIGDYHCKIIQAPMMSSALSVPSDCNLHTTQITPNQGYSLSITGNDGVHANVISTVTVEFISFSNVTIQSSITLRVENLTAQHFLSHVYHSFLEIFKGSLSGEEILVLYSLHQVDDNLDLTLAIKYLRGYKSRMYTLEKLRKKRETIVNLFQNSAVYIGYSPCDNDTCQNGGICTEGKLYAFMFVNQFQLQGEMLPRFTLIWELSKAWQYVDI